MSGASLTDPRRALLQDWATRQTGTATLPVACGPLQSVSGDASFRRYFRLPLVAQPTLQHGSERASVIAVDAPPDKENSRPFVAIAQALLQQGLHVPEILAQDMERGLMLLSDLGDTLLQPQLNDASVDRLYRLAMTALVQLNASPDPVDYPLPPYDEARLQAEMQLFPDWFLQHELHYQPTADETRLMQAAFTRILHSSLQQPPVFVHRDYHSRNLMLVDDDIGIIDFQDALRGPVTYDLVSLLRDAYIAWPEQQVQQWALIFARQAQAQGLLPASVSDAQFLHQFDLMGAQRHIKVIGIFARLCHRDGKHGYINDIPRVFNYLLNETEAYQELSEFHHWLRDTILPRYLAHNPDARPFFSAMTAATETC